MASKLYFHVSRQTSFREGAQINLQRFDDITPTVLKAHIDGLFPEGVSQHGNQYLATEIRPTLLDGSPNFQQFNASNTELIWEFVRRTRYRSRPSRYQSLFAWETREEADFFCEERGGGEIYEVFSLFNRKAFRADMALVDVAASRLGASYQAHQYWEGNGSPFPRWEIVVPLPVQVTRKI